LPGGCNNFFGGRQGRNIKNQKSKGKRQKAKGKRQKAKGKNQTVGGLSLPGTPYTKPGRDKPCPYGLIFAFCLLPFDF